MKKWERQYGNRRPWKNICTRLFLGYLSVLHPYWPIVKHHCIFQGCQPWSLSLLKNNSDVLALNLQMLCGRRLFILIIIYLRLCRNCLTEHRQWNKPLKDSCGGDITMLLQIKKEGSWYRSWSEKYLYKAFIFKDFTHMKTTVKNYLTSRFSWLLVGKALLAAIKRLLFTREVFQ